MSAQYQINVCPMSPIPAQCPICLLNVLNICPMSHMSAQCSQFLPNVLRGQISDFFRYVFSILVLKKRHLKCILSSHINAKRNWYIRGTMELSVCRRYNNLNFLLPMKTRKKNNFKSCS